MPFETPEEVAERDVLVRREVLVREEQDEVLVHEVEHGLGQHRAGGAEVEAADFGWGGTFLDVNNDGRLDLYAPAGYVTMPAEVAGVGDS